MDKHATLSSPYGEFMDLLACDAISKGQAKEKKNKRSKKPMEFQEFLALK